VDNRKQVETFKNSNVMEKSKIKDKAIDYLFKIKKYAVRNSLTDQVMEGFIDGAEWALSQPKDETKQIEWRALVEGLWHNGMGKSTMIQFLEDTFQPPTKK